MSVNSPGRLTPWFQVISNSKTGILTVKYRLKGLNKIKQIDWGLPKHHRKSPMAGKSSKTKQYQIVQNDIIFIF